MSIVLVVCDDGRPDYVERCWVSVLEHLIGYNEVAVVDDSGDQAHRDWLLDLTGAGRWSWGEEREGMAAIVRESQTQKIRLENERLLAQGGETDAENRLIAEQSELTTLSRQLEQIERQVKGAQPKD